MTFVEVSLLLCFVDQAYELSVKVIKITSRIGVSWTYLSDFDIFLTQSNGHIVKR